jgi:hypothetical protein
MRAQRTPPISIQVYVRVSVPTKVAARKISPSEKKVANALAI